MKIFICIVIFTLSINTFACECVARSLQEYYSSAAEIYVGQVNSKKKICESSASNFCGGPYAYSIKPTEYLKFSSFAEPRNKEGNFNLTYIFESGSECGAGFEVGKTYLVYAKSATFGVYGTDQCSGTIEVSKAQKSLIQLRKIKESFESVK